MLESTAVWDVAEVEFPHLLDFTTQVEVSFSFYKLYYMVKKKGGNGNGRWFS